jgi:hypothetical protein
VKVHAPFDAATLARKLGLHTPMGDRGRPPVWPEGWAPPARRKAQAPARGQGDTDAAAPAVPRPRATGFQAPRPG